MFVVTICVSELEIVLKKPINTQSYKIEYYNFLDAENGFYRNINIALSIRKSYILSRV